MATKICLCGICNLRHLSKPSTDWCPECDEALCYDCKEYHDLSKGTRNHKTIKISDYQKLPPFVLDIQHYCTEHDDKYGLFCQSHTRPLCIGCIKDHANCDDVIPLKEITANFKASNTFQELEQNLTDLLGNITNMKMNRQDNLSDMENQKEKYITEIRCWREKINQHLDKLEEQLIKELQEVEHKIKIQIQTTLDTLVKKESEIVHYQEIVRNVKQHASDLQAFLGIKKIEIDVTDGTKLLQSLIENHNLDRMSIVCNIEEEVQEIPNSIGRFGSVDLRTDTNDLKIVTKKDKQAQMFMPPSLSINDITLKLIQKVETRTHTIRGCGLASDGKMFFTNHSDKKMAVLNVDGSCNYTFNMSTFGSFDLAFINNDTVAVTSGNTSFTQSIVDLKTREITKRVTLPRNSFGITYYDGSLICCVTGKDIHVISTADFSVSTINNTTLPSFSYVTANNRKIYYTNPDDHTVTCSLLDGTRVWEFKDKKVLQTPRGITLDSFGNVYVVGEMTKNLVIISHDGKQHRQVLSSVDGLNKPSALYFDESKYQIIVANLDQGDAFIFAVQYN